MLELGDGAVTPGGRQCRGSGRRGLADSAGPAVFISLGLPTPLLAALLPSSLGAGRGRGGTLAAGRVERAVPSLSQARLLSGQVGGLASKRARKVQTAACRATAVKCQSPKLFLHTPQQAPSLYCGASVSSSSTESRKLPVPHPCKTRAYFPFPFPHTHLLAGFFMGPQSTREF